MALEAAVSDRFESVHQIAEGGMGTVYRGVDRQTGDPVAIKLLREQRDLARFAKEAVLLAQLSHPGIVRYVDHGVAADGRPYLAMEWIEGTTLKQRLAEGALTLEDTLALMRRLAGALAAAHAHGVIHRDLKPSNVVFPGSSIAEAKLIDFGIARLTDDVWRLTRTGVVVGTPGYMSPEQARANRTIDARADVFGLGCLAYECLSGKTPFGGGHAIAARLRVLMSDPRPIRHLVPGIPHSLANLIHRMLERDPDLRPDDGAAVIAEIDRLDDVADAGVASPGVDGELAGCFFILAIPEDEHSDTEALTVETTHSEPLTVTEERLRDLARTHGGALCMMCDGAFAVRVDGGTDAGRRAGELAIALREDEPDVAILVACMPTDGDLPSALERSADALIGSAVHDMVAALSVASRPIYLDAPAAAAMASSFEIGLSGKRRVLIGRRGEP